MYVWKGGGGWLCCWRWKWWLRGRGDPIPASEDDGQDQLLAYRILIPGTDSKADRPASIAKEPSFTSPPPLAAEKSQ